MPVHCHLLSLGRLSRLLGAWDFLESIGLELQSWHPLCLLANLCIISDHCISSVRNLVPFAFFPPPLISCNVFSKLGCALKEDILSMALYAFGETTVRSFWTLRLKWNAHSWYIQQRWSYGPRSQRWQLGSYLHGIWFSWQRLTQNRPKPEAMLAEFSIFQSQTYQEPVPCGHQLRQTEYHILKCSGMTPQVQCHP